MKKTFFLFGIILLMFLFSCKKKEDKFGPKVTFNSPVENQSFNVFDVIQVNASISDDMKITSVSVSLLDAQLNPAYISIPVSVTSPSMSISTQYALDDIHLESGIYYLSIFASDGQNDSHEYQKIVLRAVPKIVKKVCVVSHSSTAQTNFSFVDSAFSTLIPYRTFTGDYIGSGVSSYFQQVFMCGNFTGNFTGIELEYNSTKFNIPSVISSAPYFTGLYTDDKNNYVARYDGLIKGYDYSGSSIFNAISKNGFYTKKMCFNSGYLIAEEQEITSSTKKIVSYYSTGSSLQECPLSQNVVAFCEKNFENIFVFGNISGQCVIQLFNRTTNNLWNPYSYSLPSGSILSAVKIDENTYLIGHSNGTVYKYEYQNSSLTNYLAGYAAIQLKYDFTTNEVYVVETNKITTFDYSTIVAHHSVNSPEAILDVHLLYNR